MTAGDDTAPPPDLAPDGEPYDDEQPRTWEELAAEFDGLADGTDAEMRRRHDANERQDLYVLGRACGERTAAARIRYLLPRLTGATTRPRTGDSAPDDITDTRENFELLVPVPPAVDVVEVRPRKWGDGPWRRDGMEWARGNYRLTWPQLLHKYSDRGVKVARRVEVGDAAPDDARTDVFLAKLDRMVNEDRVDDPRDVRASLDEAQATIRCLRSEAAALRIAGEALADAAAEREDIPSAIRAWRSAAGSPTRDGGDR